MRNVFTLISIIITIASCAILNAKNKEKPIVVAILDTGLGYLNHGKEAKLCKFGHKDFTEKNEIFPLDGIKDPVPLDTWSHGTNIAGVIQEFAGDSNYCMVIIKCSLPYGTKSNLDMEIEAIQYATKIEVDIINYSGGGTERSDKEILEVKKFLDGGGIFIAAAGNERSYLNDKPYYPALTDSRVIVVGSVSFDGKISGFSNYGPQVDVWENGENVEGFSLSLTGTSQATAIATGKLIKSLDLKRKIK